MFCGTLHMTLVVGKTNPLGFALHLLSNKHFKKSAK